MSFCKTAVRSAFVFVLFLAVIGCKKKNMDYDVPENLVVTGGYSNLTSFSVTLTASFHPTHHMDVAQCGLFGSTDPNLSSGSYTFHRSTYDSELEPEYHFEINHLQPGTTYYYRAYMDYDISFIDKHAYGEIRSFTTPAITITTEEPVVGSSLVLLRGTMPAGLSSQDCEAWFKFDKVFPDRPDPEKFPAQMKEDGTFELVWNGLSEGQEYSVQAGITYSGVDVCGIERTFSPAAFVPSTGERIDMGMSVSWASCNVGTSDPEQYGKYYAWGETVTKDSYTDENYSFPGYLSPLPLEYDTARCNMGDAWRMPTKAEYEELVSGALTEWGKYKDVYGLMFISRKNGKRIFFPAAGYRYGDRLYEDQVAGYYWSSIPYDETKGVYNLYFYKTDKLNPSSYTARYEGRTVRGVCE